MPDDATFSFDSDDDIKNAQEAADRQTKGLKALSESKKKQRDAVTDLERVQRELDDRREKAARMAARQHVQRMERQIGNFQKGVYAASATPQEEAIHYAGQVHGPTSKIPERVTEGEESDRSDIGKPSDFSSRKKLQDIEAKAGSKVERAFAGIATKAAPMIAAFGAVTAAATLAANKLGGGIEQEARTFDTASSIKLLTARASRVLGKGWDRQTMQDNIMASGDPAGAAKWLDQIVRQKLATGAIPTPAQFGAGTLAARLNGTDFPELMAHTSDLSLNRVINPKYQAQYNTTEAKILKDKSDAAAAGPDASLTYLRDHFADTLKAKAAEGAYSKWVVEHPTLSQFGTKEGFMAGWIATHSNLQQDLLNNSDHALYMDNANPVPQSPNISRRFRPNTPNIPLTTSGKGVPTTTNVTNITNIYGSRNRTITGQNAMH